MNISKVIKISIFPSALLFAIVFALFFSNWVLYLAGENSYVSYAEERSHPCDNVKTEDHVIQYLTRYVPTKTSVLKLPSVRFSSCNPLAKKFVVSAEGSCSLLREGLEVHEFENHRYGYYREYLVPTGTGVENWEDGDPYTAFEAGTYKDCVLVLEDEYGATHKQDIESFTVLDKSAYKLSDEEVFTIILQDQKDPRKDFYGTGANFPSILLKINLLDVRAGSLSNIRAGGGCSFLEGTIPTLTRTYFRASLVKDSGQEGLKHGGYIYEPLTEGIYEECFIVGEDFNGKSYKKRIPTFTVNSGVKPIEVLTPDNTEFNDYPVIEFKGDPRVNGLYLHIWVKEHFNVKKPIVLRGGVKNDRPFLTNKDIGSGEYLYYPSYSNKTTELSRIGSQLKPLEFKVSRKPPTPKLDNFSISSRWNENLEVYFRKPQHNTTLKIYYHGQDFELPTIAERIENATDDRTRSIENITLWGGLSASEVLSIKQDPDYNGDLPIRFLENVTPTNEGKEIGSIYIDKNVIGKTRYKLPDTKWLGVGRHVFTEQAVDVYGNKSDVSNALVINKEPKDTRPISEMLRYALVTTQQEVETNREGSLSEEPVPQDTEEDFLSKEPSPQDTKENSLSEEPAPQDTEAEEVLPKPAENKNFFQKVWNFLANLF